MTTYTMTGPDGKDYSIEGPPGASQAEVAAQMAAAHANLSAAPQQQTGPQPSIAQTVVASPAGRFLHDAVMQPIAGLAGILAKADPTGGAVAPAQAASDQTYNDALAAQRNRPGYALARKAADKTIAAKGGSGITDQVIAPFTSLAAGISGLATGGVNGMNAASDAQASAQGAYQQAHPILSTAAQLGGGLLAVPSNISANTAKIVSQSLSPQEQAAAYVSSLADNAGATPQTMAQKIAAANGKPITTAEAIGPNGVTQLSALARRTGETADVLGPMIEQRTAGRTGRMLGDFAASSGIDPAAAQGDIDSIVAAGRQTVKPMFDQALAGDQGVWNSDLARLSNRPVVQSAMQNVVEDLKNADIDPTGMGFTAQDPETGKFIQQPRPTPQAWDMVKSRLNKMVDRDPFGKILPDTVSPGNYNINNASRALTSTLRDAIPGYGDALDASGDYLSVQKAFENGQGHILNPNVTADTVQSYFSKLTPAEQQAYNGGQASALFNKSQSARLSPTIFKQPIIQQKLAATIGSKNAADFLNNMALETSMSQNERLLGTAAGSQTQPLAEAMAQQDAAYTGGGAKDAANAVIDTALNGPQAAARNFIGKKLRSAADVFVTRGMPVPVRNAAGRILATPASNFSATLSQMAAPPLQLAPVGTRLPVGLIGSGARQFQTQ